MKKVRTRYRRIKGVVQDRGGGAVNSILVKGEDGSWEWVVKREDVENAIMHKMKWF